MSEKKEKQNVKESLKEALKEVKAMRDGNKEERTMDDLRKNVEKWLKEEKCIK